MTREGELHVAGFLQEKMFAYNVTKSFHLFSIECYGRHRSWHFGADCSSHPASLQFYFSFIRNQQVHCITHCIQFDVQKCGFKFCQLQNSPLPPNNGTSFHGREVRSLMFLPRKDGLNSFNGQSNHSPCDSQIVSTRFLISSGEDSSIQLFKVSSFPADSPLATPNSLFFPTLDSEALSPLSTSVSSPKRNAIDRHHHHRTTTIPHQKDKVFVEKLISVTRHSSFVSAVGVISISETDDAPFVVGEDAFLLFSCGGCEELFCWLVENINNDGNLVSCTLQAQCPTTSSIPDTRMMDCSVMRVRIPLSMGQGTELDDGCAAVVDGIVLAVAYSDGCLRLWHFHHSTLKFHLITTISADWHDRCLLKVNLIELEGMVVIISCATDGRIAVWDMTDSIKNFFIHHRVDVCPTYSRTDNVVRRRRSRVPPTHPDHSTTRSPVCWWQAHQSGVQCVTSLVHLDGFHRMMASGGDDQSIFISVLSFCDSTIKQMFSLSIPLAHASSIQGASVECESCFTI